MSANSSSANSTFDDELPEVYKSKMLKALTSGSIIRMYHMLGRTNKVTDKNDIENVVKNNVSDIDSEIYYCPILVVFACQRVYDDANRQWVWQFLVYDGNLMMCAVTVGNYALDLFETGRMKVGTIFKAEEFVVTSLPRHIHPCPVTTEKCSRQICNLYDVTPIATTPRSSLIDISCDMVDDIDMSKYVIREH